MCWPEIITTALVSITIAVIHWCWRVDIVYWSGYLDGKVDGREEERLNRDG